MNPNPSSPEAFSIGSRSRLSLSTLNRRTKMNTATKTLSALAGLALLCGTTNAATIYSEDFEGAVFDQGGPPLALTPQPVGPVLTLGQMAI